ncbi:uncharacterized protein METZ01_LOCUS174124 [marine metagenome]|uniref:Uncharacterized protein n=1 Tax=marine metagenome TaxID=408172 RepID=A0A382C5F9_9ZZZZ
MVFFDDLDGGHAEYLCRFQIDTEIVQKNTSVGSHAHPVTGDFVNARVGFSHPFNAGFDDDVK